MSVVVVATLTPKPDQLDAVREAILAAVPKVHAEPGCELYALHEGKGQFVLVERWGSPEALKVHGPAEPLTTLVSARRQAGRGRPTSVGSPRSRPGRPRRAPSDRRQTQDLLRSNPLCTYWVRVTRPPGTSAGLLHAAWAALSELDPASQLSRPARVLVAGTVPAIVPH